MFVTKKKYDEKVEELNNDVDFYEYKLEYYKTLLNEIVSKHNDLVTNEHVIDLISSYVGELVEQVEKLENKKCNSVKSLKENLSEIERLKKIIMEIEESFSESDF